MVITQSNAALMIALLRASLSRSASWIRSRSAKWAICAPRLTIVARSASSTSTGWGAKSSMTPTPATGKATAARPCVIASSGQAAMHRSPGGSPAHSAPPFHPSEPTTAPSSAG
jgi:hypothetical protein